MVSAIAMTPKSRPTAAPATPAALVVELVPGTRVVRDAEVVPHLPIVGNGPPGTTIHFADGLMIPLPTGRIVAVDDATAGRGARVSFRDLGFAGLVGGQLLFVREGAPDPKERGTRMTLEPEMVTCVIAAGRLVWPTLH